LPEKENRSEPLLFLKENRHRYGCSVTINGIFLKAGIPVTSRFGGVVEIVDGKPERFISLISYEGFIT